MSVPKTIEAVANALDVWRSSCKHGETCIWPHGDDTRERLGKDYGGFCEGRVFDLDEATALLWLCLRAHGGRIDFGPCKVCGGSKREDRIEHRSDRTVDVSADVLALESQGWTVAVVIDVEQPPDKRWTLTCSRPCAECSEPGPEVECEVCDGSGGHVWEGPDTRTPVDYAGMGGMQRAEERGWLWRPDRDTIDRNGHRRWFWERDCEDCKGTGCAPGPPQPTGRDRRQLAELMLGAMTRVIGPGEFDSVPWPEWSIVKVTGDGDAKRWTLVREPDSRDALVVFADRLQASGDPLGELLALWLTQAPCGSCKSTGRSGMLMTSTPIPPAVTRVPCLTCRGSGLALDARAADLEAVALRLAGSDGMSSARRG